MSSQLIKKEEQFLGPSKQAVRLHGKIVSGLGNLRGSNSFDISEGTNSKFDLFSDITIDGDENTKISTEVNLTALEFLLMEAISLFLKKQPVSNIDSGKDSTGVGLNSEDSKENPLVRQQKNMSSYSSQHSTISPSRSSHSVDSTISHNFQSQHINQSKSNLSEASLQKDPLFSKLENLGFRVGLSLAERFTLDHFLFNDTLEIVKFVCKEYWTLLFRKQIDNLKTNHRGVYVLTDNRFLWLSRLTSPCAKDSSVQPNTFTWFTCGLIRGALTGLGQPAFVIAESNNPPQCIFHVRLEKD